MTHVTDIHKEHSEKINKKSGDRKKIDGKEVDTQYGTTNFDEKIRRFKSKYNN